MVGATICLDDEAKFLDATKLYEDAYHFVDTAMGPFQKRPRVVFCSTPDCFQSFGFKSTAGDLGRWGIVIGPRGWSDYYLRHEMIHHRQAEELGALASIRDPQWFIEGMAYSLSDDPRRPLSEPWQKFRARFEEWYQKAGKHHLREEAKKVGSL